MPNPATPPVILYDATCGLCDRSVRFILRHDKRAVFHFAALGSPTAHLLAPGAPAETMVLVDASGMHVRSEAACRIASQLDAPWSWLRVCRALPLTWRDAAYTFVAARRHRWFGAATVCDLPDPTWRKRFLS